MLAIALYAAAIIAAIAITERRFGGAGAERWPV